MANPDPEITYDLAFEARTDVIMATGRSDYPNQVNNVLGFPFIFRGALDVRASTINEEMKLAAVRALAQLAREDVPESVLKAYGARAPLASDATTSSRSRSTRACCCGWRRPSRRRRWTRASRASRSPISRPTASRSSGSWGRRARSCTSSRTRRAGSSRAASSFPEGEHETILRAARAIADERIARPVLLGRPEVIEETASRFGFELHDYDVIDIATAPQRARYADLLYAVRSRRGHDAGRGRCSASSTRRSTG